MSTGRVLVVGFGNPDRGDDGLGPLVARRLQMSAPSGTDVRIRSGDGLALIEDWRGYGAVVLIDAAQSLGSPGRVHRIDLRREALPAELTPTSTHGFGLAEAIRLAATLQRLPPILVLYAIEADDFTSGAPISPAVASAASEIVQAVLQEAESLQRQPIPA